MRALALVKTGRVEIIDLPIPTPKSNEVLIKITGVGICGSDLSVFFGHRDVPQYPWVMGHEAVGEIVEIGSEIRDRQIGSRVVVEPNYCCMECGPCLSGQTSGCENRIIIGMTTPGLLADYVCVPAEFAWVAPSSMPTRELVCLEPYTVGAAAFRRSRASSGQNALVVGAGSTGLMLITLLIEQGLNVYFVEPHITRSELAVDLGATAHVDSNSVPYHHSFETSGTALGMETALNLIHPGGTVTLLGLSTDPIQLTPASVVRNRLTIRGSMIYDHPVDFASVMANPPRSLSKLLRGEFQLEDAQKAFEAARSVPGKSWISFEKEQSGN